MKNIDRRTFVKGALAISGGITGGINLNCTSKREDAEKNIKRRKLPMQKIGQYQISRLIVGGNPFSSNAHAEPLIYARNLFKHYFTHEKTVETLKLCVEHGINTFLGRIDDNVIGFLKLYKKNTGVTIPWIAQTAKKSNKGATKQEIMDNIKLAADNGAIGCFLHGRSCDYWVEHGNFVEMEEYLALIKDLEMMSGLGAHENKTIQALITSVSVPDFYMKTINSIDYFTSDHLQTTEIMATRKAPWIAFKVLGAGRVEPENGFKLALSAGADFLCVGMFDFQVEENVKLIRKLLSGMTV